MDVRELLVARPGASAPLPGLRHELGLTSATACDRSADPRPEVLPLHLEVGQTGQESWHVLADPEGNELCRLRQRVEPL